MMNRTFKATTAALMLAVSFAGSVCAGPFEDAAAAYRKGDYAAALGIIRPLAEEGNVAAQFNLGVMFQLSHGVPQDNEAAVSWYRKAAEQGLAQAQYNLGVMYANGEGVAQDYAAAHMWFNLAAASRNKNAMKARDIVAAQLTPAQIAEAHKLAREWKPTSTSAPP
jgi:TPR repeat protein